MLGKLLQLFPVTTVFILIAQSCQVLALWENSLERTAIRTDLQWDWGHTYSSVSIGSQPLTSIFSSMFKSYQFILPVTQLERGITYRGASSRLRHVIGRLVAGHDVHVGIVGGSISWGQGVSRRGETDWFSHFSKWMIEAFPRANITARNGCVPGVPSAYMILCLEQSVDHKDVELVFIEFTLNDGYIASVENDRVRDMERLVRRLLALPRRPAVVLMHSPTHGMASYPPGHPRHPGDIYKRFYETLEDVDGAIAQYYDVQMLSVRTALYRLAAFKETDGFRWDQTFFDIHPGDQGHRVMSDLAVHLVQQTAIGLLLRPFGREDEEAVLEPLPEPMYPGNKVPEVPMCIMYEDFKSKVLSAEGWEYLLEGTPEKPKPGFIATSPGSVLVMRLNTNRSETGQPPHSRVAVWVQHLKSYQHMGVAEFRCVSGCRCDPHREDAHISRPVSQLYVFRLDVSQSEHCDVEVELLPETSSGEHKFKIAGVVVAEGEDKNYLANLYGSEGSGEFGMNEHNGNTKQMVRTRDGLKGDVLRRRWWRLT